MSDKAQDWRIWVEIAVPDIDGQWVMDTPTSEQLQCTIRGTRAEILKHVPEIGSFFGEKKVFGVVFCPEGR